jgi:peptidyl-prolyl cis-trans isomerase D
MWVKGLMVFVAVTFFGGFGLLSTTKMQSCLGVEQQTGEGDVLVTIDADKTITEREFRIKFNLRLQEQMAWLRNQFPDQPLPDDLIDRNLLSKQVMKNLIEQILVLEEADKMGITVSSQEIQLEIANAFRDEGGRRFNKARYLNYLSWRGMSQGEFESMVREELKAGKMLESVSSSVGLFPEEVEERYAFEHEKIRLEYALFDHELYAADVAPSDTAIKEYYDSNMSEFFLSQTRRVEYVSWSFDELLSGVSVSKDEIEEFYEGAKDRYLLEPEKVRAQHILIRVDRNAPEADIEAARALISKIHDEATAPVADFGELARKYSEDGSRDQGGDLGWFTRQEFSRQFQLPAMVDEFEEAAFSLEVDQISEPVQTQFGFHIIKSTGIKDKEYLPLDEMREEVEEDIRHGKLQDAAAQKAESLKATVTADKSFEQAAEDAGREVRLSDWFQMSDDEIFGMDDSNAVIQAAFAQDGMALSDPVIGDDHAYLIRVVETKPERQGTLEEVRDRIFALKKPEVELEATLEKAGGLLERLKAGEIELADVGKDPGVDVRGSDTVEERYLVQLEGIRYSDTLQTALARINNENPWPDQPLLGGDTVAIIHFLEAEPPDMSRFDEERQEYENQLLTRKQNEIMEKWLDNLKKGRVVYTDRWKEILPRR